MIIIKIDEKVFLEKALKKYKKKFENLKLLKQLRERKEYKKKSIKKREQLNKARYIQKKFEKTNEN